MPWSFWKVDLLKKKKKHFSEKFFVQQNRFHFEYHQKVRFVLWGNLLDKLSSSVQSCIYFRNNAFGILSHCHISDIVTLHKFFYFIFLQAFVVPSYLRFQTEQNIHDRPFVFKIFDFISLFVPFSFYFVRF